MHVHLHTQGTFSEALMLVTNWQSLPVCTWRSRCEPALSCCYTRLHDKLCIYSEQGCFTQNSMTSLGPANAAYLQTAGLLS